MKQFVAILLSVTFLIAGCKKEPKTATVTYKIVEKTSFTPTYTVSYTLANGSTQSKGGISASLWVSDKIADVEMGKAISLSVEGNGGGEYDMYVYINGNLHAHRIAEDGHGRQVLNTEVPYF